MMLRSRLFALLLSTALLTGCSLASHSGSHSPPLKSLERLTQSAPSPRQLDIQHWSTTAGTQVLFMHAPELAMFDLRLTFAAGSSQEAHAYGLASLTNDLIGQGTRTQSADDIAVAFESLGAVFEQGSYRDMAVLRLRTLSAPDISRAAVDLFSEVISQPSFPEAALNRTKNQLLAGFEYSKKNPGTLANLALFEQLYGAHPYAHSSAGTEQSVPQLTRQQLIDFHQQFYNAQNGQLAIIGDLSRAQAEQIAELLSNALPRGAAAAKVAPATAPPAGRTHIEFPSSQTHILLAQLGIERGHPDYAALYLANQILGGSGFGSRLMEEVREKRGLTYGIYSGLTPMQAQGPFMISVQTRAELSEATLTFVQSLFNDFIVNGPTEAELNAAKRETLGSFPLTAASNSAILGQLSAIGFYDLPHSWLADFMQAIQALDLTTVQQAVQRHLDANNLVIVTVGPTVESPLPLPDPVERDAPPAERQH